MKRSAALLAVLCTPARICSGQSDEATGPSLQIMADGYYAREAEDREWRLRIVGQIPSLCGAYILVHDRAGKMIHHGVVPHGSYPPARPFVVTVPKDGARGDYKIKIVGHQVDLLGIQVPLTDLDEVYGGRSFSVGHDKRVIPFFKVPRGVKKIAVAAYKGHLQVRREGGTVVADTKTQGTYGGTDRGSPFRYCNYVECGVAPDEVYSVLRSCFYFRFEPRAFLTFAPRGWFVPEPGLDEVKWWKGVAK